MLSAQGKIRMTPWQICAAGKTLSCPVSASFRRRRKPDLQSASPGDDRPWAADKGLEIIVWTGLASHFKKLTGRISASQTP